MAAYCGCGRKVHFAFEQLGCIACGAPCCPGCAHQLESTHYCGGCAESLLKLPGAPSASVRP
jgi:hypothetical protein